MKDQATNTDYSSNGRVSEFLLDDWNEMEIKRLFSYQCRIKYDHLVETILYVLTIYLVLQI